MKKALCLLLLCCSFICMANTPVPFQHYYLGEFTKAKPGLEKLAKEKNGKAFFLLAKIYLNALDEPQNISHGLELVKKSAELNYLPAQMYLGKYYFIYQKSIQEALPWFKKAALNGDVNAQTFVALTLLNGLGVKGGIDKAKKYIILAAKNDNPAAQYELARTFLTARHSRTRMMGRIWLKKSAEQNFLKAELLLGEMLYTGKQYDQEKHHGLALIKKVAAAGDKKAQAVLKQLEQSNDSEKKYTVELHRPDNHVQSELKPAQQYAKLQDLLRNARVSFQNIRLYENKENFTKSTPKVPFITKNMIVKPNFSFVMPSSVPLSEIITYTERESYKKSSPDFMLPKYRFIRPKHAQTDKAAFKALDRLASHGYVKAQFMLGKMYEEGIYVNKNDALALKYYLKSAKQNYLKADYAVARFYLQGKIVDQDTRSAIKWLAKSALRGSANAQYVLGFIYEYGYGDQSHSKAVQKNLPKARAMYSLAASHGFPYAQYRLAQLYSSGVLNPNNNQEIRRKYQHKAYRLYKAAAQQGIQHAQLELAFYEALKSNSSKTLKKVFQIAKAGDEKGNNKATLLLAILYERGIGTTKQPYKAQDLFEDLADDNMSYAQYAMGTHEYIDDPHDHEPIELLQLAADNGCVYAEFNLAIIAYKNKNTSKFLALLKQASDKKFNKASILLADYYLAQADPATVKEAADIYNKLAKQADSTAELKLGYMYENGIFYKQDITKAIQWYRLAATHDNPVAEFLLGRIYQAGKGVERNLEKAIALYKKSAKKNFSPAQVALGFINQMEKYNPEKAKHWYEAAVEQHNPFAQYNLAVLMLRNKLDDENSIAFNKTLKAAQTGFVPAKNLVAKMYLYGIGTGQDAEKAVAWYQKSAKEGDALALYALGLIAESGIIGEINTNKALQYYQQAANKGCSPAEIAVARFYQFGTASQKNISKAVSMYHQAANNGNAFAHYWALKLSKPDDKTVDPKYCVKLDNLKKYSESVWNKISNIFRSKPNKDFLSAINTLNQGNIRGGQKILNNILSKHPNFTPAKILLQSYSCS